MSPTSTGTMKQHIAINFGFEGHWKLGAPTHRRPTGQVKSRIPVDLICKCQHKLFTERLSDDDTASSSDWSSDLLFELSILQ